MVEFFVHDPAGRIVRAGHVPTEADAAIQAIEVGEVVRAGAATLDDYWTGSAVAPRPAPSAPPALVAEVEALWSGLPPGAEVTAVSGLTGQAAGVDVADQTGTLALTLPAGPWRLEVAEAFPAVAASFTVEVVQ